jgi:O-antigen/teichoic acid export membrane protein
MSSFKKFFIAGILWKFLFYVSAFLLNAFIANKLGATDSGRFYYLLNNLSFVVLVLSLGFDAGVNYYNGAREISRNQLFTLSVFFCVAVSILFIVIYFLLIHFSIIPHHAFNSYIVWYVIGSLSFNVFTTFYYSEHKHIVPNLVLTICNIILILVLQGILFNATFSNLLFIRIYLSMNLVAALLVIALLYLGGARYGSLNIKNIIAAGIIKFSLQSFILAILFTLLLRCDYWLVDYYCTRAETGNYLQTSKFVQLVMLLPSLASFSLLPLIVRSITSEKGIEFKLIRLVNIYIYSSLFICIALVIAGQFLFPFIYGDTYDKMYKIFLLLIPGIILMAATYPLAPYFSAKKMIHINLKGMAIAIVILVFADLLLIPHYSVYGAAVGCSLGYCSYFLFLLYHFKKQFHFRSMGLIEFKSFFSEIKFAIQKRR